MTRDDTTATDRIAPLTDPEQFRDDEAVEFTELPPEAHQGHFDVYEPIDGMAVVGVTNAAGEVLVLRRDGAPHPVFPHGQVGGEEDYAAVGGRAVREQTGVDVSLDRTVRVRRKSYRPESDGDGPSGGDDSQTGAADPATDAEDDRLAEGYDVVFEASPRSDDPDPVAPDDDVTAEWVAHLDLESMDGNSDVVRDLALFVR